VFYYDFFPNMESRLKSLTIFRVVDPALISVPRWAQQALKLAFGYEACASDFFRGEDLACDPSSDGAERHPGELHDVAGTQIF
jgi:hypothetical protein